ncbi:hypothetical protein [Methylobacterium sp. A54F]
MLDLGEIESSARQVRPLVAGYGATAMSAPPPDSLAFEKLFTTDTDVARWLAIGSVEDVQGGRDANCGSSGEI